VNQKDRAQHYDHNAYGANPNQYTGENRQASGELGDSHQIADEGRLVERGSGKSFRAWTSESSEQNGTPVIEKRQTAGDSNDQQCGIDAIRGRRMPVHIRTF
jgi:hypothetical protein